jgi:hypothetical protein
MIIPCSMARGSRGRRSRDYLRIGQAFGYTALDRIDALGAGLGASLSVKMQMRAVVEKALSPRDDTRFGPIGMKKMCASPGEDAGTPTLGEGSFRATIFPSYPPDQGGLVELF